MNKINNNDIDIALPKQLVKKDKKQIEKYIQTINVVVLMLVFIIVSLFLLIGKRPTISKIENRDLAKFPSFSSKSFFGGEYTAGIANYYNDTVPLRSVFKDITSNFRAGLGIELDGVIIYGNVSGGKKNHKKDSLDAKQTEETTKGATTETSPAITTDITTTITDSLSPTPAETVPVDEDELDDFDEGILSGGILVYKNRGIPVYYGSFAAGQNYASFVNAYKADLGEEVNVYSLVAPTAQSFYMPRKYADKYGSEEENLINIREYLNGVTEVDAYNALLPHKKEDIYSRTDHHWSPLGAFYSAQEFAKKANVPFPDLSTYEKVIEPGYVGTLYGWSQVAALKDNPEDFIYYKPSNQYTTTYYDINYNFEHEGPLLIKAYGSSLYCTFMGSDEFIVHVNTDVKNGRTLAIIKDSYGNALVPCLTGSFENIYVIDMRYFNLNAINFLREHGVTDVLFAMNTFSATGGNSKHIEKIRTK